jgi:hypothetical protein
MPSELLPLLIAVGVTFLGMQVAVALTQLMRRHDYALFEDRSKDSVAREFPIHTMRKSPAEERRRTLARFVDRTHQAAIAAQTRYYNAVVRSASGLVVAFIALVLGNSREDNWPWMATALVVHPLVEHVLMWVDAIAIILILILFLYAGSVNRRWLSARVGSELLRQYQFLELVFPSVSSKPRSHEDEHQFDFEADLVKARVQHGPTKDIMPRIERFWSERKLSIERRALRESDIPADALLVYLERRARRQLGWFTDSKARLEYIGERRKLLLLVLYGIAVAVAVLKLAWFLYSKHSPPYLSPSLLIITGISGAMTAHYINQNARSLIHRYNTQQRRITKWLQDFGERWSLDQPALLDTDVSVRNEICSHILQFEDLMIEELMDWVHITSQDAMELAP